jgi:hypothetical protein
MNATRPIPTESAAPRHATPPAHRHITCAGCPRSGASTASCLETLCNRLEAFIACARCDTFIALRPYHLLAPGLMLGLAYVEFLRMLERHALFHRQTLRRVTNLIYQMEDALVNGLTRSDEPPATPSEEVF